MNITLNFFCTKCRKDMELVVDTYDPVGILKCPVCKFKIEVSWSVN